MSTTTTSRHDSSESDSSNGTDKQETIEDALRETAEHLSERVRPHLEEGKRRLESLNTRARTLITEHPAACLLGALALGYLAARLARRERS